MKPKKTPAKKLLHQGADLMKAEAEMERLADVARAIKKTLKQTKKEFKQAKKDAKRARKVFEALTAEQSRATRKKRPNRKPVGTTTPPATSAPVTPA